MYVGRWIYPQGIQFLGRHLRQVNSGEAKLESIREKSRGCLEYRGVVSNPFVIYYANLKPNKKTKKKRKNRNQSFNFLRKRHSQPLYYTLSVNWLYKPNHRVIFLTRLGLPAVSRKEMMFFLWCLLLCNESIIDQACLITMAGYRCSSV